MLLISVLIYDLCFSFIYCICSQSDLSICFFFSLSLSQWNAFEPFYAIQPTPYWHKTKTVLSIPLHRVKIWVGTFVLNVSVYKIIFGLDEFSLSGVEIFLNWKQTKNVILYVRFGYIVISVWNFSLILEFSRPLCFGINV